jgi:hypothetical protein
MNTYRLSKLDDRPLLRRTPYSFTSAVEAETPEKAAALVNAEVIQQCEHWALCRSTVVGPASLFQLRW